VRKILRAGRFAMYSRKKLGHWRCCLCCAHARRARTDRSERARRRSARNVTTRDKSNCYAVYTAVRERQLDTLTLTECAPAGQTPSVLLVVRSRCRAAQP
jgi:hypothetical protein